VDGTVLARRLGGNRAALIAVAALVGSAFGSASFRITLPSGWMFILTPWAIHLWLEGRLGAAAALTALSCYTHLGGFLTAPFGIVVAALITRRWRDLILTALGVALLTAPYWIHVLRSLPWYAGTKGDTAWLFDPLVDVFWIIGVATALRAPTRSVFLLAWAAAPLAWAIQDASRFVAQSSLAGAVLGGVTIAPWIEGWRSARGRAMATAALIVVACVFPFGVPAFGAETLWLVARYPRLLDWEEMRADADVVRRQAGSPLVLGYTSYVASGLAVWTDLQAEKGHWIEVRPPIDPADDWSVADKLYVLAIAPDDDALAAWAARTWIAVLGGGRWSSVIAFRARPSEVEALAALRDARTRDAAWIADFCENNLIGDVFALLFSPNEVPRRRAVRGECRARMTRMQVAELLYGEAVEPRDPALARRVRQAALAFGWMAALVGDEQTLDYRSAEAHARMREDIRAVSRAAAKGTDLVQPVTRLLERYLAAARGRLI
jgi:hypothetical protein